MGDAEQFLDEIYPHVLRAMRIVEEKRAAEGDAHTTIVVPAEPSTNGDGALEDYLPNTDGDT